MERRIDEIAASFDELTPLDFAPGRSGLHALNALCDEVRSVGDAPKCAPILFRTIERLGAVDDVDLGAPGPLVHTLETWPGVYEPLLAESVNQKPTSLSVWMLNRILNTRPRDADIWFALLQHAAKHPSASIATKLSAQHFVDYQLKKNPDLGRPSNR